MVLVTQEQKHSKTHRHVKTVQGSHSHKTHTLWTRSFMLLRVNHLLHCRPTWRYGPLIACAPSLFMLTYLLILYLVCWAIRSSDRKLPIHLLTYLLNKPSLAIISSCSNRQPRCNAAVKLIMAILQNCLWLAGRGKTCYGSHVYDIFFPAKKTLYSMQHVV